jgi:hypothetical protein
MKKRLTVAIIFFYCCLVNTGCNTAGPEKYFDLAVLNSNMLVGFANAGQLRELESPSVKLAENSSQPVAMKRNEIIEQKIKFIETNLEKLKELKVTPDTKDMLQTSLALHEYILPVYKMEYGQLAKLYDEGASNEKIQLQAQTINDKYYSHFNELYTKLISIGKLYAERNSIKVNWGSQ